MSFGGMVTKTGMVIMTEGVKLTEGRMADIQNRQKFPGIPQADGNHDEEAKRVAAIKYIQRTREEGC